MENNQDPSDRTTPKQICFHHHLCAHTHTHTYSNPNHHEIQIRLFGLHGISSSDVFSPSLHRSFTCTSILDLRALHQENWLETQKKKNAIIKSALANLFHLIYRRQCVSVQILYGHRSWEIYPAAKIMVFFRSIAPYIEHTNIKSCQESEQKILNEERTIKANVRKSKWQRRKEHHTQMRKTWYALNENESTWVRVSTQYTPRAKNACPKFIEQQRQRDINSTVLINDLLESSWIQI